MSVRCVPVKATLSARGEAGLTPAMRSHVEVCRLCTAEVEDERLLAAGVAVLRGSTMTAPAEVLPRVMEGIGPWAVPDPGDGASPTLRVVAAAAVATAAATAAAGTAVLVLRLRHRAA